MASKLINNPKEQVAKTFRALAEMAEGNGVGNSTIEFKNVRDKNTGKRVKRVIAKIDILFPSTGVDEEG